MPSVNRYDLTTYGPDEDALLLVGDRTKVKNLSRIETYGPEADGIFVAGSNTKITNHGTVEAYGDGASAMWSLGHDNSIINFGRAATYGDALPFGVPAVIAIADDRFEITNFGEVESFGSRGWGLFGAGDDGRLVNVGSITTYGLGLTASHAMMIVGNDGLIFNAGSIEALNSYDSSGMVAVGNQNLLVNAGRLQVGFMEDAPSVELPDESFWSSGTAMSAIGDSSTVINYGEIIVGQGEGTLKGIILSGNDNNAFNFGSIDVSNKGALAATIGINNWIHNYGSMSAEFENVGIFLVGEEGGFVNYGSVHVPNAQVGAFLIVDTQSVINYGSIDAGFGTGVWALGSGTIHIENHGTINSLIAVDLSLSFSWDIVKNYGQMAGDVLLGDGDDLFLAGAGGSFDGVLTLGEGNDFVIIEENSGQTIIADFCAGAGSEDIIDLTVFFDSMEDLLSSTSQSGADAVIQCDPQTAIILQDILVEELDVDDFLFGTAAYAEPTPEVNSMMDILGLQVAGGSESFPSFGHMAGVGDADILALDIVA